MMLGELVAKAEEESPEDWGEFRIELDENICPCGEHNIIPVFDIVLGTVTLTQERA